MNKNPKPLVLSHSLELFVPTCCRCHKELPAEPREAAFAEAQQKIVDWFGGGNIRVESMPGLYKSTSGETVEETVDVIFSNTDAGTLEEHREDFLALAAELANRLTQESVACRVDGKMLIYPSTEDPKPHRCAGGSAPKKLVKPLRADQVSRMQSLQAALQRLSGIDDVRDLFCNVLHYEYRDEMLPTGTWPETVKQCLAPGQAPQVIADQNGFKIIYLQLSDDWLRKSHERRIVQRVIKDLPGMRGLVVVSDIDQKLWNLVNVKFGKSEDGRNRVLLRRMRVGPGRPVRTAVERLTLVDVEQVGDEVGAAELQDLHDRAFDVEAVTRQFFSDITNWYFWALEHSSFPKDAPKEDDGHDHISLIRLITRLVFCWFLREKGLIPDTLFDRRRLDDSLVGFEPGTTKNTESVFYRAILQNLFFATLNTEMNERGWARENQNFMAHSLYRFKDCFRKPATALGLFKSIPFLNGGLFECLDRDLGKGVNPRYVRIDGFSRESDSQPTVPDYLFFGRERQVDLSAAYGSKKFKRVQVRGLIDTLLQYNFTVEENTPIEEEVALDPELCGKVFENLLAAYNPETGATARKQTGSFYTPREIVNYMVDEVLITSLLDTLRRTMPSAKNAESRLRSLFAYAEEEQPFNPKEVECLISAIDSLRTLDPAVGSGAFPMGLLHKLVFVIGKLDPRNELWRERQVVRIRNAVEAAEKIEDLTVRSRTVDELEQQIEHVNEAFERNELDYGRKLYLIENCIYGVDIQPIAVQIAKMRFFVSLIVDQRLDPEMPNMGVRPLPNLETKFVAANTLISVDRPGQQLLRNLEIDAKEADLRRVRERHFEARTLKQKAACRKEDSRLRAVIAQLLEGDGWGSETAQTLASWDPYDQNASAEFFDPEWMFGLLDGFDVVIGNPPYVRIQTLKDAAPEQVRYFKDRYRAAKKGNYDLYVVFVERGLQLTAQQGQLAYILPHKFFTAQYGEALRGLIADGRHLRHVVHFGDQQVFSGATNYVCLLFLGKAGADECEFVKVADVGQWLTGGMGGGGQISDKQITKSEWNFVVGRHQKLFDRLSAMPVKLGDVASRIYQGCITSADGVFLFKSSSLSDRSSTTVYSKALGEDVELETGILRRVVRSGDIGMFRAESTAVVLFPYEVDGTSATLFTQKQMKAQFPKAWKYLVRNRGELQSREQGKFNDSKWYRFGRSQNLGMWEQPKLLVPYMISHLSAYFDTRDHFYFINVTTGGYGIKLRDESLGYWFLCALLNSNLIDWYLKKVSSNFQGGYFAANKQFIEKIPVPVPMASGFPTEEDCAHLGELAESLQRIKAAGEVGRALDLETELNGEVHRLFGLTDSEIAIVTEEEGAP